MTSSRSLVLLLLLLSCDEHLPPREDPTRLFSARLAVSWSLTAIENIITLRLILVNTYDEIIEGTEEIEGKVSIALARDPTYTREYVLSGLKIDHASFYNPVTGSLSIPPGDSISFFLRFDWMDGTGRDMRSLLRYIEDPTCPGRRIADRETFIIHGEARLFPRIAAATAIPMMFEICHADVWVNPKFCPPVTGPTDGCLRSGVSNTGNSES